MIAVLALASRYDLQLRRPDNELDIGACTTAVISRSDLVLEAAGRIIIRHGVARGPEGIVGTVSRISQRLRFAIR